MAEHSIYGDIAARTGGDIYIGVVGPVRTGKSTFIKRFMEALVLPHIKESYARDRARDELPQSAGGRTVMTTEPKFIPDEAVELSLADGVSARVRMVDCVGYLIPEVLGTEENGQPRMVRTPWQEDPMPFVEAAEMGTHKVIHEHATIGMLVTSDGSIGEIGRESYVEAEERIVSELKEIGKPFAVILNTANPASHLAVNLAYELEAKYGVPVALVNCLDLNAEDIRHILEMVLHEFPVCEVALQLPEWTVALDPSHRIRQSLDAAVRRCASEVKKVGDIATAFEPLTENEYVQKSEVESVDLGSGKAHIGVVLKDGLYYDVISEMTGFDIRSEEELLRLLCSLSSMKQEYDKVADALRSANESG